MEMVGKAFGRRPAVKMWELKLGRGVDQTNATAHISCGKQKPDREQPVLPMMPGVPERRTHSYVRHGTTSLFAALDVTSGFVIGKCYKRHRAGEFLNFLKEIDAQVPEGLDIHIVMDNYATHKTPKIKAWLARRPHYHVHFTPTSASSINQVERWFAELAKKRLRRGVHTSVRQLEADIRAFIDRHNQNPRPFRWTKSADQILASVKRFCHKAQQTLCSELFGVTSREVTQPTVSALGVARFPRGAILAVRAHNPPRRRAGGRIVWVITPQEMLAIVKVGGKSPARHRARFPAKRPWTPPSCAAPRSAIIASSRRQSAGVTCTTIPGLITRA
jgi:transposase